MSFPSSSIGRESGVVGEMAETMEKVFERLDLDFVRTLWRGSRRMLLLGFRGSVC